MNPPSNRLSYSIDKGYILCFYPTDEQYPCLGSLQKKPSSAIISLLSIFKSPLSMDLSPILRYLDYISHWIIVVNSECSESKVWFQNFLEKALPTGGFYPLFRQELFIWDLCTASGTRLEGLYAPWKTEISDWKTKMGSTGLEPVTFCV